MTPALRFFSSFMSDIHKLTGCTVQHFLAVQRTRDLTHGGVPKSGGRFMVQEDQGREICESVMEEEQRKVEHGKVDLISFICIIAIQLSTLVKRSTFPSFARDPNASHTSESH